MIATTRASCCPRLSVLFPVCNHSRFPAPAIQSVPGENRASFEQSSSDEAGAADSTWIIARHVACDKRARVCIRYLYMKFENRKKRREAARGEHVKFIIGKDRVADASALATVSAVIHATRGPSTRSKPRGAITKRRNLSADGFVRVGENATGAQ